MTIYTLNDPETGEVRYVGKTCYTLNHRLHGHFNEDRNSRKTAWVSSLRKRGLRPNIEELEIIPNSDDLDWQVCERFWIAYLKFLGCPLTNLDSGGWGGRRVSEETKKKISEIHKANGHAPSKEALDRSAELRRGKHLSPEHKKKVSMAGLGRKREHHTAEVRSKISKALTGRVLSKETIARRTATCRERNGGNYFSEARMERLHEFGKIACENLKKFKDKTSKEKTYGQTWFSFI